MMKNIRKSSWKIVVVLFREHDTKEAFIDLDDLDERKKKVNFDVVFASPSLACIRKLKRNLEAFSVYDSRAGFIIFLFGDPHLLEG